MKSLWQNFCLLLLIFQDFPITRNLNYFVHFHFYHCEEWKGMNHTSHKTQGERYANNIIIKKQKVDLQDLFHQSFLILSSVIVLSSICSCSLLAQHTVCELWTYKLTKNILRISNQRLYKNRLQKEGERGRTSDFPARRRGKANKAVNKVCRELISWSYLSLLLFSMKAARDHVHSGWRKSPPLSQPGLELLNPIYT